MILVTKSMLFGWTKIFEPIDSFIKFWKLSNSQEHFIKVQKSIIQMQWGYRHYNTFITCREWVNYLFFTFNVCYYITVLRILCKTNHPFCFTEIYIYQKACPMWKLNSYLTSTEYRVRQKLKSHYLIRF